MDPKSLKRQPSTKDCSLAGVLRASSSFGELHGSKNTFCGLFAPWQRKTGSQRSHS